MQAIGERLRDARMRREIDIAEVAAATKIRSKYLRALENEDFDVLPGPTFVKTFLRTYAEYLGLDAQLLVEEYRAGHEPRELEPQPFAPAPAPRRRPRMRAPRPPRPPTMPTPGTSVLVGIALVLVILLILGLTAGHGTRGGPHTGGSHHRTQTHVNHPPRRLAPQAPTATSVALHVVPVGPTYICIDHGAGTAPVFEGIISSPMTFRGKEVRINAGRSSVALTANHVPVQIPATALPIGYDFTPQSTTPLPPAQRPCIG